MVENILNELQIDVDQVLVGEIHLTKPVDDEQREKLRTALLTTGPELVDDRAGSVVEKIKQLIIKKARNEVSEADRKLKLSAFITSHINNEYTYISSLFSDVEGRTIENYFIEQRIEKAKELLVYGEQNLSEIAFSLDYSSVAHLSNQFKKITGLTPSHFKTIGAGRRKNLDKV
jgi:AraC-like DNA-binding protein